ncbi:MAG: NADH-quinone oxidoreductase subunit J [Acetobacteraceae bacterium]|nr:NADH-quinone oxidoreductase subunit J [Acetobacteraceae bacterium]
MPNPVTDWGFLLVLAVMLPIGGVLLALLLGGRRAELVVFALLPVGLGVAAAIATVISRGGQPIGYNLGGWAPPLGVALRADGLSVVMLVTTSLLISGIALFARPDFQTPETVPEARAPLVFWVLLLALWGALNAVFVARDLFNLYVTLELLTFGAVPLVCLDGRAETLTAALRYLLFALVGSVLYLLGNALLYGTYGTLDVVLLSSRVHGEPSAWVAAALMTCGLLAKTALFPLHLWLPPAHAGAPAPASALLSSLVVKGPFFIIVRLWFDAMPGLLHQLAAPLLGLMGAGAILAGSVLALRQRRLKLLIAYSTVAQIGYLFLMFPLAGGAGIGQPLNAAAWTGGTLQAVSHAFAKAAMFTGAGLIAQAVGHDQIADLRGVGRVLPLTTFGLGLAGLSLMGLPPSGGFLAKWLQVIASIATHRWWWALVMLAGGLLAGGYMFRVLAPMLSGGAAPLTLRQAVPRHREAVVLAFALCAVLLGVLPLGLSELLQIGRSAASSLALR